jgi:acetoin utilization deacetylase AcuC-like enzyme
LLGGLRLTKEGLRRRDALVFELCRKSAIGIAVVLGGGYAANFADTVDIHCNTMEVALCAGA